MPYDTLTKAQRAEVRRLSGLAYERDLSEALRTVRDEFRRWEAGEIDAFDLEEVIHRFHQGPARELFNRYDTRNLSFVFPQAVARGAVREEELSPALLDALRPDIEAVRAMMEKAAG